MALSLATTKYTEDQVLLAMTAGGGQFSCRFELLDLDGSFIDHLENVSAAQITWDRTSPIVGDLDLRLLADERLRNAPYQYLIQPVVQVGPMPDGGKAEYPYGRYVWIKPRRTVLGSSTQSEEWSITCQDQLALLDATGPGFDAYVAVRGTEIVDHIIAVLAEAGFTDTSGVEQSEAEMPETTGWHFNGTTRWPPAVTSSIKKKKGKKTTTTTTTTNPEPKEDQPETWLGVLMDLHKAGGYEPPFFDSKGLYRARLVRKFNAATPDVIYRAGEGSVTLLPADIEPDTSRIANRVMGTTDSTSGPVFDATADLNDYLPTHPLAERNIGKYIDEPYRDAIASSQESLQRSVELRLVDGISNYDKMSLDTVGFLALHEVDEIVGVTLDGDPELSGPNIHLFREAGWSLDLFTGQMGHDIRRLYFTA